MSKALESYYERELTFISEFARTFARGYPAEAGGLVLPPDRTPDPHAERFVEGFALLAARIHHKLDYEFPELNEALLAVLYPHLLAPIPAMTIAQLEPDPEEPRLAQGVRLERHRTLRSRRVGKPPLPTRWRTGYPVTLWPLRVSSAPFLPPPFPPDLSPPPGTAAILQLRFECLDGFRFADLALDELLLYLSGEQQLIANLYEVLFNHTTQVVFQSPDPDSPLPPFVMRPAECLEQVGLNLDEGLLPCPVESFVGFRLITELFSFPNKFLFLKLKGWQHVCRAGYGGQVEVVFFLDRTRLNLEQGVSARTFQLGCTPVVNLFEKSAEPVAVTHTRHEYRVVPTRESPRGMEIHAIDEVNCFDPHRGSITPYQPFYSFAHDQNRDKLRTFWYASRRPSTDEKDAGTDVFLVLVDLDFDPRLPANAVLDVRLTCTNRDLPQLLRAGDELAVEPAPPAGVQRARCLSAPTPSLRPPLRHGAHWRLMAQSSLNHVSLTDPQEGRLALQELLRLCDFTETAVGEPQRAAVVRQMIEGITSLRSRLVLGRVRSAQGIGLCRGTEFTAEFDEQKYIGTGVFLFASVLERFLGLYASVNSFSQLVAKSKQGEGVVKKWPPRAAERQLL